jgi:hypothetical protein
VNVDTKAIFSFADRISWELRQAGCHAHAEALRVIVHDTSWTTSSEPIGELGLALLRVRSEGVFATLPESLRADIDRCLATVRQVWPNIGRA